MPRSEASKKAAKAFHWQWTNMVRDEEKKIGRKLTIEEKGEIISGLKRKIAARTGVFKTKVPRRGRYVTRETR